MTRESNWVGHAAASELLLFARWSSTPTEPATQRPAYVLLRISENDCKPHSPAARQFLDNGAVEPVIEHDALKLTVYFGERDRAEDRFLADALVDLFERHAFRTSILLRGSEGFGIKHQLHTQRLLTLSEDLPIVAVAVDTRQRIGAVLPEVQSLVSGGLITLERVRLATGDVTAEAIPDAVHEATKLTIYCGRQERLGGTPAYIGVVDLLHRRGVAGATVLLGIDGTAHGRRARAKFFSRNAEVPLMIIAVGDRASITEAAADLLALLDHPLMTFERILVCKRDGMFLAEPRYLPDEDESGLALWQKLMVYSGEQARHQGHPLYIELIHRLRSAGANGATAVRGIWGYHGDHMPHGDTFFALRRRVPVVTTIVDTPERIRQWFTIVDELTDETGLVTSEVVPASRALGPEIDRGGLTLARHTPAAESHNA
jgi:PII-like signaling protein